MKAMPRDILPSSFVSKDELKATIAPEAIPGAGTYIVTLKCEGEAFPSPIEPISWWALSHIARKN